MASTSYPFLPSANTAPSGVGIAWNFSEAAFQDAIELAVLLSSQPTLQSNATAGALLGQLLNDTVLLAFEENFATPGRVLSDTLNDFDNTLLEFGSFAGSLGISSYLLPLFSESASQFNPASALSGVVSPVANPTLPTTPTPTIGG